MALIFRCTYTNQLNYLFGNGTAQIQTNRQQYLLPNGGLAVIFPNILHAYQTPPNSSDLFILAICPLALTGSLPTHC